MKICCRCKKQLSLTDFYKDNSRKDGLMLYCKNCDRQYRRKMRKAHPDTYKEMGKRNYANTKDRRLAYNKDWRSRNKIRTNAHIQVRIAVRKGELVRQPCFCGVLETDAHHEDYTKPLDVQWLCRRHHVLIHS